MKFTPTKAKNSSTNSEGWGMGFFLVFFPEENTAIINNKKKPPPNNLSPSPSPSSAKFTTINTLLRRTNSTHILTTAQSTISICALLIFITLLLFTLSTFEPTTTPTTPPFTSRRHLSSNNLPAFKKSPWPLKFLAPTPHFHTAPPSHALQGMGILINRGTKAMNDLTVCHLTESVTVLELRLFLRVLQRSTLTSRSDLIFILPNSAPPSFNSAIREETDSFFKLIHRYKELNTTHPKSPSFDLTQFFKSTKKEKEWAEPIWGRRIQLNYNDKNSTESTRLSFGSVVSFELDELDPENSLSGFLNDIPMSLRRWACYPMLLGRIRRNFKHTLLVDIKDVLVFNDPLGRVRNKTPESVYLIQSGSSQSGSSKHSKKDKNSDKTQSGHKTVNPGVIMGGVRGVRRLANAVLTEIARAATQHKRRNSVTESGILSQLAGNRFLLKNVNLVLSTESIPDVSGLNSGSGVALSVANLTVVRRGNSNNGDVNNGVIMKHLCSFPLDSSVYSEC
ncbi:hypothetical protein LguiB_004355 [Lonicera macranthoides]